jgi:hypothetical protein
VETLTVKICDDCGADCIPNGCATGYAQTVDGRTICYPCADALQRAELAVADSFCGYMSGDGRRITTWTGGSLATVTQRARHRGGFGGDYWTFRAVSPDGARWYGRGAGPEMFARLKRSKH